MAVEEPHTYKIMETVDREHHFEWQLAIRTLALFSHLFLNTLRTANPQTLTYPSEVPVETEVTVGWSFQYWETQCPWHPEPGCQWLALGTVSGGLLLHPSCLGC